MMITIVARNIVRDGKREAFLEAVRPLIAASRSEEGNIAYDLYEDVNEANAFCFIENGRTRRPSLPITHHPISVSGWPARQNSSFPAP